MKPAPYDDRRSFLKQGAAISGVALLGGGVLWGKTAYARSAFAKSLVSDASTILVAKEHDEILQLPPSASEEMKLWFTGACLNSVQFIDYICTEGFATKISQFATTREKEMAVENEFFARVLSHSAIHQRVDLIASETGAILDRNWASACGEIAKSWNLKLNASTTGMGSDLQARLDLVIDRDLKTAIQNSTNSAIRPTMTNTLIGIGASSIMLLPLATMPPPYDAVVIPAFALIAITHFANYAIGLLFQDTKAAKIAISDRLALLGNRVAQEFESELKVRIADLHSWQNSSLRQTAREYANETIGYI